MSSPIINRSSPIINMSRPIINTTINDYNLKKRQRKVPYHSHKCKTSSSLVVCTALSVCVISNFLSFCLNSSLHILGSSSLGWWLRPATSCSPATTLSISTSTASPTGDTAPFSCYKGPYVSRDIQESWSNIWTSPIIKVLHDFGIISNNTTISKHFTFPSTLHHGNKVIQIFSM